MNQHFNSTRFGRLLRKHTIEHLPSYAMSTAVLVGGVLVVLGTLTYLTRRPLEHETQLVLYLFGMLAAGAIFTASVFAELGQPRGAAPALLLPASHFEKYLVAWLYSLPIFCVVYTLVFMLINFLVLQLGNQGWPYEMYDFSRGSNEWVGPLLSYALLHSVALWGAIYFSRLHIIKTAFTVLGAILLVIITNLKLLKTLLPVQGVVMPFGEAWVGTGEQHMPVALPDNQHQLILLVVPVALALLLWAAAYARLTEKQI
jgi:hypothetical protein